jgi:hypothetical protein
MRPSARLEGKPKFFAISVQFISLPILTSLDGYSAFSTMRAHYFLILSKPHARKTERVVSSMGYATGRGAVFEPWDPFGTYL